MKRVLILLVAVALLNLLAAAVAWLGPNPNEAGVIFGLVIALATLLGAAWTGWRMRRAK